jgi:hypothetical protein
LYTLAFSVYPNFSLSIFYQRIYLHIEHPSCQDNKHNPANPSLKTPGARETIHAKLPQSMDPCAALENVPLELKVINPTTVKHWLRRPIKSSL